MKFSGKILMAATTVSLFFIFAAGANAGNEMKTKPKKEEKFKCYEYRW